MSEELLQHMLSIIDSYNYPIITPPPSPGPPIVLRPIHEEWEFLMQKKLEAEILDDLINESNKNKLSASAPEWCPVQPPLPKTPPPLPKTPPPLPKTPPPPPPPPPTTMLPPLLSSIQLKVYNIFKFKNFPVNLNINYIMKILGISSGFKYGFVGSLLINNIYILESDCKYIKLNYFSIPN